MSKFRLTLTALAVITFTVLGASSASAQATRTWVSGVGDDVNPCSRTAPCKTYAGAISKTAVHGEISTLDPGGFGAVTITKSITIEGTEGAGYGSILHSGTTGVSIAYDSFSGEGLTQRTVRLRNLNVTGITGAGVNGIRITSGVNGTSNTVVILEDLMIDGFAQRGVSDERSGGGRLFIHNTTIRNNGYSQPPPAALNTQPFPACTHNAPASTGSSASDTQAVATLASSNTPANSSAVNTTYASAPGRPIEAK